MKKLKSLKVEKFKSDGVEECGSDGVRSEGVRSEGVNSPTHPITHSQLNLSTEQVYRQCRKREIDRERSHRDTKQGAFEASFVSLDRFPADAEKFESWYSDNGKGAEDIISACDGDTPGGELAQSVLLKRAREKVRYAAPELLEVFNLVVKNGTNRKESIWELMRTSGKRTDGMPPEDATSET